MRYGAGETFGQTEGFPGLWNTVSNFRSPCPGHSGAFWLSVARTRAEKSQMSWLTAGLGIHAVATCLDGFVSIRRTRNGLRVSRHVARRERSPRRAIAARRFCAPPPCWPETSLSLCPLSGVHLYRRLWFAGGTTTVWPSAELDPRRRQVGPGATAQSPRSVRSFGLFPIPYRAVWY